MKSCCEPDCLKPVSGKGSFCDYHQGKLDRIRRIFERIREDTNYMKRVSYDMKGECKQ
jgi:hypothetical protein